MKKIYAATNLPEAYLVRDLLGNAGVVATILNEHAMSALGEVPVASAYPQVWIERDHQEGHARQVIAEYESRRKDETLRVCGKCGESSPGQFELCWNCSTPFTSAG
ncbi:MAG TPA: DUF2007 domain-containing protein [Usitatibacteraceae bacterium]|nr:DUF2007 domain-containing protein [Usitatibacteraceae bacterium]